MIHARRATLVFATATLVLAACSGGGGGASNAPSAGPASGAPSVAPAASSAAPASAAASVATGTGMGVCELATKEEVAAAFGVPTVVTKVLAGPPDTCIVESDTGRPLASWNYNLANGGTLYDAFVQPGQSTDVAGIGDRAAFVDNTGLMIIKGDRLVVVTISGGADLDEDAAATVSKQIGTAIAGRM